MKNIFLEQRFIKEVISNNTFDSIQTKFDYNEDDIIKIIETGGRDSISHPIQINSLQKHINELNEIGCNFVEISYHNNQQEYELCGFLIDYANDDVIINYKNKEDDYRKTLSEINELELQIKNIKLEYNKRNGKI
jgi:predicted GTPase